MRKSLLMVLIMMRLSFLCNLSKIETKSNICTIEFYYENRLVFPIYISDQKFENLIDLLLVIDENKSNYVYIKVLTDLCFTK